MLDEEAQALKLVFQSSEPVKQKISEVKFYGAKGVKGLKNLGNTCYLNSSVQCLANIRSLQRYFKATLDLEELKFNDNPEYDLIYNFSNLIKEIWSSDSNHFSPQGFFESLKQSCSFFKGIK